MHAQELGYEAWSLLYGPLQTLQLDVFYLNSCLLLVAVAHKALGSCLTHR